MVPRSRREARLQETSLPTCGGQVTRSPAGAERQLHSLPTWNEGPALICLVGPALLCRRQRCFAVVNLQRGWDEGRPHCAALEGLWTRRGGSADHICVFVTGLLAPQRHGRDSWLTTLCRRVRAAAVCVWCRLLTEGRNT